jgi:hypothetical protein
MATAGAYQFRQKPKHEYAKPPATMPTAMAKSPSDNQAPIIPPMATLATNQKIQIARLFIRDRPLWMGGGSNPSEGVRLGESRRACGHKRHNA